MDDQLPGELSIGHVLESVDGRAAAIHPQGARLEGQGHEERERDRPGRTGQHPDRLRRRRGPRALGLRPPETVPEPLQVEGQPEAREDAEERRVACVEERLPGRDREHHDLSEVARPAARDECGHGESRQGGGDDEQRVRPGERVPLADLGARREEIGDQPADETRAVGVGERRQPAGGEDDDIRAHLAPAAQPLLPQRLERAAAEVEGQDGQAGEETAMRVDPEREERRREPQDARVRWSLAGAEAASQHHDQQREERVGEHLGPDRPPGPDRARGEQDGDREDEETHALARRVSHHQAEHEEAEQAREGVEPGRAEMGLDPPEGDLGQVLVVDPGMPCRRVRVRRRGR